jgi:rhodanese-related sulfurtransferase
MYDTITVADLADRIGDDDLLLVDVREVAEFRTGHVPGAVNIPMSVLPVRVHELPKDRPVHIICQSGGRSMQVTIWLAQQGYQPINVAGGTGTWVRAGGPLSDGARMDLRRTGA